MQDFQAKFFPNVLRTETRLANSLVTDPVTAAYCKYNDQVLQLVVSSLYISALFSGIVASKFAKLYGRKVQLSDLPAMHVQYRGLIIYSFTPRVPCCHSNQACSDMAILLRNFVLCLSSVLFCNQPIICWYMFVVCLHNADGTSVS